ncbi:sensor protein CpxA [Catenovulum agarivorans DS-2]|uniref:histidine kinase n=1 Tax=Catenovulum agarivorans DS-2 TaxID=1328313 RepID=W7QPX9_9ALTE|nr:ATP-binding protein [Catenovulum agarivorans]EWH11042.1 sensor protein CpxA [Catenovulum agarivorans DS-2]
MINSKFNPFSTLFGRIFIGFWGTVLLVLAATFLINQQFNQYNNVQPIESYHKHQLKHARKELARADNYQQLEKKISRLQSQYRPKRWIVLRDTETGKLIKNKSPLNCPNVELKQLAYEAEPLQVRVKEHVLFGPESVSVNGKEYKMMMVYKTTPRADFYRALWHSPEWLKFLIAGLLTILPCWLIARGITIPIKALTQSARNLAEGKLSYRVPKQVIARADEVGQLAKDFNYMAEKIEGNLALHQRLLGDVSHELRTPLTRLSLALALLAKNPQNMQAQIDRMELELDKLDEMIGNVLRLAKLENDDAQLEFTAINLQPLITDICTSAQLECDTKNIQLNVTTHGTLMVNGDAMLLSTAIENIVRNAIKYSPQNSNIKVTAKTVEHAILIQVSDSGPGVPDDDIDKIFNPFYRVEKDRDRISGGTGLGLSIAKKAISRHEGTISAFNKEQDPGLTVEIRLPAIVG